MFKTANATCFWLPCIQLGASVYMVSPPIFLAQLASIAPSRVVCDPAISSSNIPALLAVTTNSGAGVAAGSRLRSGTTPPIQAVVPSSAQFDRVRPCDEDIDSPAMRFCTRKKLLRTRLEFALRPCLLRLLRERLVKHVEPLHLLLHLMSSFFGTPLLFVANYMSRF